MLYRRKQLPELYYIKNRHNSDKESLDYENIILTKTLSPYLFLNKNMNSFLTLLQPLLTILFEQTNIVKNFKNYNIDKHKN